MSYYYAALMPCLKMHMDFFIISNFDVTVKLDVISFIIYHSKPVCWLLFSRQLNIQ